MRFRKLLMVSFSAVAPSLASIAAIEAITPSALRAQDAPTPIRFSVAAAAALPVSDLGTANDVGFSLAFRGEGRLGSPGWGLRGDLSWDRFSGRGDVDSYSYLSAAGNLVYHNRGGNTYEFGGLGLYNAMTEYVDQLNRNNTNPGMQAGVGVNLSRGPNPAFMEFGLVSVFEPGGSAVWFPLRFGVRF
jgi:hypothetical protein